MPHSATAPADDLLAMLPYGRRYARALTGTQRDGDAIVASALRAGLPPLPGRLGLFAAINRMLPEAPTPPGQLSQTARQLLLLTALEGLGSEDAGLVLGLSPEEARREAEAARAALKQTTATDVLIIEDEPVIAMDLRMLVERCGHRVSGVASTEAQAVQFALERPTGLILADVNLGRGGDGISAVRRILHSVRIPVIFVTAYPERLLTAEELEPAFIMSKPFDPLTLAISTYQAVTAGRVPIG